MIGSVTAHRKTATSIRNEQGVIINKIKEEAKL
jgi:hypothetical protein